MKIEYANKILEIYKEELKNAPCSKDHHLNIIGGLMIHLDNVGKVAEKTFPGDETVIALAKIHDIGKARVYMIERKNGEIKIDYASPSVDHILWTIVMIMEAGFRLTPEEINALQFHHGSYAGFQGNMTELAARLHYCDLIATVQENWRK